MDTAFWPLLPSATPRTQPTCWDSTGSDALRHNDLLVPFVLAYNFADRFTTASLATSKDRTHRRCSNQARMARRPSTLEFHEHVLRCPYCRSDIIVHSLMKNIVLARRTCPICRRLMLIRNGRAYRAPGEAPKKSKKRKSPIGEVRIGGSLLCPTRSG